MTPDEFGRYVAINYEKLCGFVRSIGTEAHDAEDIVQQTLLRLFPRCGEINPKCPGGFFFAALRHAVIDHWREQGRQPRHTPLDDPPAAPPPPVLLRTDLDAAEERLRARVRQALAGLTSRERRAFAACWKHQGDRQAALAELGLAGANKTEKYRAYDGPLFHARRKLALTLKPSSDLLDDVGYDRVWGVVTEELSHEPPGHRSVT